MFKSEVIGAAAFVFACNTLGWIKDGIRAHLHGLEVDQDVVLPRIEIQRCTDIM
jgi:hypothetical protein